MDTPDVRITIDELRSPDGDGLSLEQWAQLLVLLSHRKGVAVEVDTGGVGNSVLEVMRQYGVRCHPMPKVPGDGRVQWREQEAFERGFQKGVDWASGKRDAKPMPPRPMTLEGACGVCIHRCGELGTHKDCPVHM